MKRRLLASTLFGALLILGCGGLENTTSTGAPAGNVPSQIAPLTSLKAVVLSQTPDTLISTLAGVAAISNGTPDPLLHDLLVVDSSNRNDLDTEPTILKFLAAGKTVLFLNPDQAAKALLYKHCPVRRNSASRALAIRRSLDSTGHPEFFVHDWPIDQPAESLPYYQTQLAGYLQGSGTQNRATSVSPLADSSKPPTLLAATIHYGFNATVVSFASTENGGKAGGAVQWTSRVVNYTFELFLENSPQQPNGIRQWLIVTNDIQASPLNPGMGTTEMRATKQGGVFSSIDIGWFQSALSTTASVNTNHFRWQKDAPSNTNNESQVTTGFDFSLDLNAATPEGGGGVSNTFNYSSSTTRTLTAWKVTNLGAGAVGSWLYENQDPYQHGNIPKWGEYGFGGGFEGFAKGRLPNDLARSELQAHTVVGWTTADGNGQPTVYNDSETIAMKVSTDYANSWNNGGGTKGQELPYENNETFDLDLGLVVPIPVNSITFPSSPVNAHNGGTIQGTIHLASPAKADTQVLLFSSNADNASVNSSVIVRQGQSEANFPILLTPNNISPGGQLIVNIRAFYGQSYTSQLILTNN